MSDEQKTRKQLRGEVIAELEAAGIKANPAENHLGSPYGVPVDDTEVATAETEIHLYVKPKRQSHSSYLINTPGGWREYGERNR